MSPRTHDDNVPKKSLFFMWGRRNVFGFEGVFVGFIWGWRNVFGFQGVFVPQRGVRFWRAILRDCSSVIEKSCRPGYCSRRAFAPQGGVVIGVNCMGGGRKSILTLNFHNDPQLSLSSETADDLIHSRNANVPGKSQIYVALGNYIADLRGLGSTELRRRKYSLPSSEILDDSMYFHDDTFPETPLFYVGLEKCIGDLKGLLIHSERHVGRWRAMYVKWWENNSQIQSQRLEYYSLSSQKLPCTHNDNVSGKYQFYVGLEKCMEDLKGLLFYVKVLVCGVHCMGDGGKTILPSNVYNDPQIKDDSMQSHDDNFAGKSQIHLELKKCIVDFKRPWFHSEVSVVDMQCMGGLWFHCEVSVVGVQCMGCGLKSVLALNAYNDPQIKDVNALV
ncbi:hypothetical protein SUGI_0358980 [Cryptomeria japonica]|nr:hypothetical protein SUGI_0358980 [Cryptomeria japonica]